jgi:Family of unknown function (DUF6328)
VSPKTVERSEFDQAVDDPGRRETEQERQDRNVGELLQELRIAGLGVQVLFGFLLELPFTSRFSHLSAVQRDLYLCTMLMAALAIVLLVAPVAQHRITFRRHRKGELLRMATVFAVSGLAAVGLSISTAVLLLVSYVMRGLTVPLISGLTFSVFWFVWFQLPLMIRHRHRSGINR